METGAVETVRYRFLVRNPFLGALALASPWVPSETVRTVGSDGDRIYYNPNHLREAAPLVLEAELMHVLLHAALGHPWRGGSREPRRWRIACDLALVPLFLRSIYDYRGVVPIGADPVLARDRSAEMIYPLIPPPGPEEAPGESDCWLAGAEARPDPARIDRWRERMIRAAQSLEYGGHRDEFAAEVLTASSRPRLDWRTELARFLERRHAQDFSWVPPSRRHLASGWYLPGTRMRSLGELVIALDSSGSIDPATAEGFLAEARAIAELSGATGRVLLLEADEAVRSAVWLDRTAPGSFPLHGRGGTDFRAVFEYLEQRPELRPSALVYLTDGQGPFPSRAPTYPVLWVLTGPAEVPFGERVLWPGPGGATGFS